MVLVKYTAIKYKNYEIQYNIVHINLKYIIQNF